MKPLLSANFVPLSCTVADWLYMHVELAHDQSTDSNTKHTQNSSNFILSYLMYSYGSTLLRTHHSLNSYTAWWLSVQVTVLLDQGYFSSTLCLWIPELSELVVYFSSLANQSFTDWYLATFNRHLISAHCAEMKWMKREASCNSVANIINRWNRELPSRGNRENNPAGFNEINS